MSIEYLTKLHKNEIINGNINRPIGKSSYIQNIHVTNQAIALEKLEKLQLKKKLDLVPEPVREQLRQNYVRNLDVKNRNSQKQQFQALNFFQQMIRQRTEELGMDYRKFSIGGTDDGLFEKFFRIEPKKYISQSQFIQVMRIVFGSSFNSHSEKKLIHLYMAFDMSELEEMDWRAFLFLLVILMQVIKPSLEHMKLGYALFSSVGVLDYSCNEPLKLSQVKDMIQTPVILSNRPAVLQCVDDAWFQLLRTNLEALKYTKRRKPPDDHNDTLLTYKMFLALLTETDFKIHFEAAVYFGKKDMRPHTYILEQEHYHPVLMEKIIPLRREMRCDNEADLFLVDQKRRRKLFSWKSIEEFVTQRRAARSAICDMYSMWFYQRTGDYFDKWRRNVIMGTHTVTIQRIFRGYIGRKRRALMVKLNKMAEKVQSLARQRAVEIQYQHKIKRRDWAVTQIQKVWRGFSTRRCVQGQVEARFETGMRQLARDKKVWLHNRILRAAIRIQIMIRRFLRRRKVMLRLERENNEERVKSSMEAHDMENYRTKLIYKTELEGWFAKRKAEYDIDTFIEGQTQAQRSKILSYRRRVQYAEREELAQRQREKEERAEAAEIDLWLKRWDETKKNRHANRAIECRFALLSPETPQQKELKKELQKKIKLQIPLVLKRADKMRIPMEIPEAKVIATDEVIKNEQNLELERVCQEMHEAATQAVAAKEAKRLKEIELDKARKKRRVKWAATKIQSAARQYGARKIMRAKAYKRYEKKFDASSMAYYYTNIRTHKTQWNKPLCLGSFDVNAKNHWVALKDNDGDAYYYNPNTWEMQWETPHGVLLCDTCGPHGFAIVLLSNDEKFYCEQHMNEKAQELIFNQTLPRHILFKEFDGSVEESINTNFKRIQEKNWHTHTINLTRREKGLDMANRCGTGDLDSDEEEELDIKMCSRCDAEKSTIDCVACNLTFCQPCFERKHKNPPWSNHTHNPVKQPVPKRKQLKKQRSSGSFLTRQPSRVAITNEKEEEEEDDLSSM